MKKVPTYEILKLAISILCAIKAVIEEYLERHPNSITTKTE